MVQPRRERENERMPGFDHRALKLFRQLAWGGSAFCALVIAGLSAGCVGSSDDGSGNSGGGSGGNNLGSGTPSTSGSPSTGTDALPDGTITFSADSVVTTDAKWGDATAHLKVSHVGNLRPFIGLSIAPAVDGIPCTEGKMSDSDPTVLELTCAIRPGNSNRPKPKLVVKARTYTASIQTVLLDIPRGTLDVPVTECDSVSTAGVTVPQLCKVDSGSTADVGNGFEGIFEGRIRSVPSSANIALIANDGTYVAASDIFSTVGGKLQPTEGAWTFETGYPLTVTHGVIVDYNTFRAGATDGTYIPYTSDSILAARGGGYSVANALAVTASSVAGTWTSGDEFGTSFTISVTGDQGTITGVTGGQQNQPQACTFSGTIALHERGSSKNMYDIALTPGQAAGTTDSPAVPCKHSVGAELKGLAALNFVNTGTELNPVYAYVLDFAVYQIDKEVIYRRLTKQ